jgi:hypothetical protein
MFHGSYLRVTSRDTTSAVGLAEAGIVWYRVRSVMMVKSDCQHSLGISAANRMKATSGAWTGPG